MRHFKIVILLLSVLCACTEDIDLNLDSTYPRIIVDASLSTDYKIQYIVLTKSADYFSDDEPMPINNATVAVTTSTDTFYFFETITHKGIYASNDKIKVRIGMDYKLAISNVDIDNDGITETFSASSHVYPPFHPDSIQIVPEVRKTFRDSVKIWRIKLFGYEPKSEGQAFMFNVYKNHIPLTDTFTNKYVTNYFLNNTGGYLNGTNVASLVSRNKNEVVNTNDTITLEVLGIPEQYRTFFYEARIQEGGAFPVFSGPPANVITNIEPKEKAVGFFVTYSTTRISRVYK